MSDSCKETNLQSISLALLLCMGGGRKHIALWPYNTTNPMKKYSLLNFHHFYMKLKKKKKVALHFPYWCYMKNEEAKHYNKDYVYNFI